MPPSVKRWVVFVVLLVGAYFFRGGIYAYTTAGQDIVTLVDFVIKTTPGVSGQDQKYLIFTDKGEFENIDSGWRFKWDSSRLQNQLTQLKGRRVKIYYYGFRNYYLSWYPNIYKFEFLDSDTK